MATGDLLRRIAHQVLNRIAHVQDASFFIEFAEDVDGRIGDGPMSAFAVGQRLLCALQFVVFRV